MLVLASSNFESRQFQSISAKFSDWGLLRSPQSEASDYRCMYFDHALVEFLHFLNILILFMLIIFNKRILLNLKV